MFYYQKVYGGFLFFTLWFHYNCSRRLTRIILSVFLCPWPITRWTGKIEVRGTDFTLISSSLKKAFGNTRLDFFFYTHWLFFIIDWCYCQQCYHSSGLQSLLPFEHDLGITALRFRLSRRHYSLYICHHKFLDMKKLPVSEIETSSLKTMWST